ncbi:MAG: tyrosine-type recombinase/integrase [Amaricoccus sp.]
MPLTDSQCRAKNATGRRIKLSDGGGLRLVVTPTNRRTWEVAYRFEGKARTLIVGPYPATGLAGARLRLAEVKVALQNGIDPGAKADAPISKAPTFETMADAWRAARAPRWCDWTRTMRETRLLQNVLPDLGLRPVDTITPRDVLAVVRKVEARGAHELARRIAQDVAAIFRFAKAEGHVVANPADGLHEAFAAKPRVRHHAMIAPKELPGFMAKLQSYDGAETTRLAIEFVLRTATRTAETRFATWGEVEGDLWRIPAARMKMHREHLVPLAPGTARILARMRELTGGGGWIFPGDIDPSNPMSENTLLFAMYRMGLRSRATIHGLRRTFSTACNEAGLFSGDWIEMQLAHVDGSVRGVYNAADWLPHRVKMMTWWGEQVDRAAVAELL